MQNSEHLDFILRNEITGRYDPTPLTWDEAQAIAGPFDTIVRIDEVAR